MNDRDLVDSLQSAIARADAAWTTQPSHLRRRLEEELGSEARRHRAQVHQLVVAAEERIPMRLQRGGWSTEQRDELVALLVSTRGWTTAASAWAVETWAAALELSDHRPPVPTPTHRSDPARGGAPRSGSTPPLVIGSDPTSVPSEVAPFGPTELPGGAGSAPTELPGAAGAGATELPGGAGSAPTELPGAAGAGATELPGASLPPPPPTPVAAPGPTSTAELPTRGTTKCTRRTSAFLDREIDVAYDVKAGPTPAWLLLAVPVGLAAFVVPALSGVLLMAFILIILVGLLAWPSRILAIAADRVWLLAARGPSKPKAVLAEGTRDDVEFAGGRPFPSVRLAGQRLWFQFPITGAARRIPTSEREVT